MSTLALPMGGQCHVCLHCGGYRRNTAGASESRLTKMGPSQATDRNEQYMLGAQGLGHDPRDLGRAQKAQPEEDATWPPPPTQDVEVAAFPWESRARGEGLGPQESGRGHKDAFTAICVHIHINKHKHTSHVLTLTSHVHSHTQRPAEQLPRHL